MAEPARLRVLSDHDKVTDYVREVADLMGMRDTTFEVVIGELPTGERARCECVSGRAYVRLTLRQDFREWPARLVHEAVVHEVAHTLVHPLVEHMHDLQSELGRAHFEALDRVFIRDVEKLVDKLTTAWVEIVATTTTPLNAV